MKVEKKIGVRARIEPTPSGWLLTYSVDDRGDARQVFASDDEAMDRVTELRAMYAAGMWRR